MARKSDTRTPPPKTSGRGRKPAKAAAAKAPAGESAPAKAPRTTKAAPGRAAKVRASALEAARAPILAATAPVASAATAVKDKIKEKSKKGGKKALKAARKALKAVPEVHAPSLPGVPHQVGEAFKTIGTQIAGALNTEVGRGMMAGLLMYVATSLTKAAASTEAGESAKSTLLNTGAKIGAAAADAGAKMVETGHSTAEVGTRMLEEGRAAAEAGVAAAGDAAGSARKLVRDVASVAVSAVGGAVVEAATKALSRRGRKPSTEESAAPAEELAPKRRGRPPGPAQPKEAGTASPIAADAGHRPQPV